MSTCNKANFTKSVMKKVLSTFHNAWIHLPLTVCPASPHVQRRHMSSITTCPASPHVQRHHMSSVTTCPASPHVQRRHMSSVTTCPASPHVQRRHMSSVATCPASPHVQRRHMSSVAIEFEGRIYLNIHSNFTKLHSNVVLASLSCFCNVN